VNICTMRRWTARGFKMAMLSGVLAWSAADSRAQTPTAPRPAPGRTYTKNTTFSLPIQMDDAVRATLTEVQLYVKSGPHPWVLHESVAPSASFFTCKAPADGEYQFMLVTVDRIGKRSPADIEAQPPSLRVVVDTTPPALDVSASIENGAPILSVKMADANADLPSIQAVVTTNDGEQRALSPAPGRPGCFLLSTADVAMHVRVAGSDLAGNSASRDAAPRELIAAAAWSTARPTPMPAKTMPPSVLPPAAPSLVTASYRPTLQNPQEAAPALPKKTAYEQSEPRIEIPSPPTFPQTRAEAPISPAKRVDEAVATDEHKKILAERDELRAQLALAQRERDDLNAKMTERTNEVVELRVQLGMRMQERQQLARELQQLPRDVQALFTRIEATLQAPAPVASSGSLMPRP
jgi:hypothetical protein